jgi:hypothetical protein
MVSFSIRLGCSGSVCGVDKEKDLIINLGCFLDFLIPFYFTTSGLEIVSISE